MRARVGTAELIATRVLAGQARLETSKGEFGLRWQSGAATPLSHARKVLGLSGIVLRSKAPSPLSLCRRSPKCDGLFQQLRRLLGDVAAHQGFAHEDRAGAGPRHAVHVVAGMDAALGNEQRVLTPDAAE